MQTSSLSQRLDYWRQEIVDRLDEYQLGGISLPARQKLADRLGCLSQALEKIDQAEEILFSMK